MSFHPSLEGPCPAEFSHDPRSRVLARLSRRLVEQTPTCSQGRGQLGRSIRAAAEGVIVSRELPKEAGGAGEPIIRLSADHGRAVHRQVVEVCDSAPPRAPGEIRTVAARVYPPLAALLDPSSFRGLGSQIRTPRRSSMRIGAAGTGWSEEPELTMHPCHCRVCSHGRREWVEGARVAMQVSVDEG